MIIKLNYCRFQKSVVKHNNNNNNKKIEFFKKLETTQILLHFQMEKVRLHAENNNFKT